MVVFTKREGRHYFLHSHHGANFDRLVKGCQSSFCWRFSGGYGALSFANGVLSLRQAYGSPDRGALQPPANGMGEPNDS